jgi:hypothetical protein
MSRKSASSEDLFPRDDLLAAAKAHAFPREGQCA